MFHRRQRGDQYVQPSFFCEVCAPCFTSQTTLNRHKKEQNHRRRDIEGETRKRKTSVHDPTVAPSSKKTKQQTISDVLRSKTQENSAESDTDSDDAPCGARPCLKMQVMRIKLYGLSVVDVLCGFTLTVLVSARELSKKLQE